MTADELGTRRAALVIAHPGHELRLHGWLEIAKPVVFVLTDGSGHTGRGRLSSTTRVLTDAGARPGRVYGRFADAEIYDVIRTGYVAPLVHTMCELVAAFSAGRIEYVVGDALEGFNPSHDLCRFLINAAVLVARRESGLEIANYDVLLDGDPRARPSGRQAPPIVVDLDEPALARKLAAADQYEELKAETQLALARFGARAFKTECLRPVTDPCAGLDVMDQEPPPYELYGEQRVRTGYYSDVIRYRANVRPLMHELWDQAGLDDLLPAASTAAIALAGASNVSSHLAES